MTNCIYIYTTPKRINYAKIQQKIITNCKFVYSGLADQVIGPYICFKDIDSYQNLPIKTYNCMRYFLQTGDEYFIKINDDCLLDITKLDLSKYIGYDYIGALTYRDNNVMNEKEKFIHERTHFYKIKQSGLLPRKQPNVPYIEGAFVIMSRRLVKQIIETTSKDVFTNYANNYITEDICVGDIVSRMQNIKILDIRQQNDLYLDITKDFLSVHPISSIYMEKLLGLDIGDKMKFLTSIHLFNDYNLSKIYFDQLWNDYQKANLT